VRASASGVCCVATVRSGGRCCVTRVRLVAAHTAEHSSGLPKLGVRAARVCGGSRADTCNRRQASIGGTATGDGVSCWLDEVGGVAPPL